jgi:hypothetical protein
MSEPAPVRPRPSVTPYGGTAMAALARVKGTASWASAIGSGWVER